MINSLKPILILGAGPAGLALAIRLAQRGRAAVVFDEPLQQGLMVGESLIPATVTHLRELGVESELAATGYRKTGTQYRSRDDEVIDLSFAAMGEGMPGYAYNVQRSTLNEILRNRAEGLGVKFVNKRADLEVYQNARGELSVRLTVMSAAAAGIFPDTPQPLLVDATGKKRLISGLLRLPMSRGRRNDLAYFAHFEGFGHDGVDRGNLLVNILKAGWSWRVPLSDTCTSVGVVVSREHSAALGSTPEERLMRVIRSEAALRQAGMGAVRVTNVCVQPSQELLVYRGYGPGWVLIGDAFGQTDPMLSPGVFTALESAKLLDELVLQRHSEPGIGQSAAMARYNLAMRESFDAWSQITKYFYSGQIFSTCRGKRQSAERLPEGHWLRRLDHFVRMRLCGMTSGVGTNSWFSQQVLRLAMSRQHKGVERPGFFAVKNFIENPS